MAWPDWLGVAERRWKKSADEGVQPSSKTAWDWLQLLIVPAMLAGIAILFIMLQIARIVVATSRSKTHRIETSLYAHPYAQRIICSDTRPRSRGGDRSVISFVRAGLEALSAPAGS